MILNNPNAKELLTDSVSNSGEIRDLMDAIEEEKDMAFILDIIRKGKFKDIVELQMKKDVFNNKEKMMHIIAARYLRSVSKGAVSQEIAYIISENHQRKSEGKTGFDFNIPSYISEAIEWICQEQ